MSYMQMDMHDLVCYIDSNFNTSITSSRCPGADPGMGRSGPAPPPPFWQLNHANSAHFGQARSQGVRRTPQICQQVHFLPQSGPKMGFCRRVRGVRFKKVHFWGLKGLLLGGSAPPKIDPGYGPDLGALSISPQFRHSAPSFCKSRAGSGPEVQLDYHVLFKSNLIILIQIQIDYYVVKIFKSNLVITPYSYLTWFFWSIPTSTIQK